MSRATIRDVAKMADVGVGTVSRVLNNSPAVSESTREKVLAAIEKLNYSPNPIAQQLSSGRTRAIAVTLPFLTYPSFVQRLRGVQRALANSGYELILYSTETPEERESHFDLLARRVRADGVLVISIPLTEAHVQNFLGMNVPTVLVDVYHPALHRVFTDDMQGGYMATKHLIDLGHQKIAFVSDLLETELDFVAMRDRYKGYKKALVDAGIGFDPKYHKEAPHGREEAQEMAQELLTYDDPPTAIFAGSDTQAIGVLDAAKELGIKVPEQLSVIGYDNIRDAEYLNLTTISQPLFTSGFEGAKLLLSILAEPSDEIHAIDLPLELIERSTTGPAPGKEE